MVNRRIHNLILCAALSAALLCGSVFEAFASEAGAAPLRDPNHSVEAIESLTSEPKADAEYDGYIVKLDENATDDVDETAMAKSVDEFIADDMVVVDSPSDVLAFTDPAAVEYIEPNYKLDSLDFPADDPRDLMYMHPLNYQWGIKYVGAKSAWLSGYNGSGVNIAIIDSGIVYGHEDLNQFKIVDSLDCTINNGNNGNDKDATDEFGHGSMVASVIAAETDNVSPGSGQGIGMAGLTDKAGLLVYKVIGSDGNGNSADVIKAYDRILHSAVRVDVINLSIGHTGYSRAEYDMIRQLDDRGIIIVAAAGNNGDAEGEERNEIYYPAGYIGVIGVGSVGAGGKVSSFSAKNTSVDISAPGEAIIGFSHTNKSGTGAYMLSSGTSFAAPIVAAAAVMFKQHNIKLNSESFLSVLKSTATEAGAHGYDVSYGHGILSLPALINHMDKTAQTGGDIPDRSLPEETPEDETGVEDGIVPDQPFPEDSPEDEIAEEDEEEEDGEGEDDDEDDATVVEKKSVKKCKVVFAVNGGKRLAKSKRVKSVTKGKKYGKLPTPKRGGYKFRGWYTKRKGGVLVNRSTVLKSGRKTLTLYAHWKKK